MNQHPPRQGRQSTVPPLPGRYWRSATFSGGGAFRARHRLPSAAPPAPRAAPRGHVCIARLRAQPDRRRLARAWRSRGALVASAAPDGRPAHQPPRRRPVHGLETAAMLAAHSDFFTTPDAKRRGEGTAAPPLRIARELKCGGVASALQTYSGHAAPVAAHARMSAPNDACVPGAGSRPAPGCHAQPTSESSAMCVTIWSSE